MSSTPRQPKKPKQKALPPAEVQEEEYDSEEYYEDEAPPQQMQQAAPQQMQQMQQQAPPQYDARAMLPPRAEGYRPAAIRESRIKDRPAKPLGESSLSIKIELDLEVEVDLYARVKGDVTIGLM
ncbi:uncharacterized protein L3040_002604 [Drepanopeziza brunnea f. sp. 'multigermtubi']|uniref:Uncharacterized protein n=1 Tax=Marssonina brunnea f. sp. multigermtubi (strain MB_m1) TaxID=1072389 RepID=K1X3B5_MARBU|nr:uncharacterized protein MBM_02754 [Drepanopeziza brunnea f. sp. 'multigermtubi' MB_m1]EKD19517.1 hypothetical protein MBM_02754 [Drepanopeziza brunnea f. sp. 'multigermtubi' MB_m1]KAJ5050731.1 hypothetical protein L3040_002604 [Drepanopeziza brunnea f. sp. 'multigermtubi']